MHNKQKQKNYSAIQLFSYSTCARERGAASIIATLFVLSASIVLLNFFAFSFANSHKIITQKITSQKTFYAAEAGIEDQVYRIKNQKNYTATNTLAVGSGQSNISISTSGNTKTILSEGTLGNLIRRLQSTITITTSEVSFHYGVQVGNGGFEMDQNSQVNGNVYSNGSVLGANGATIAGDLITAGTSSASDVIVYGNARSYSINDSKICGNAYYQSIDSGSLNFLNNPSNPCPIPRTNGTAYPDSENQPLQNMPISDANIAAWKNDAATGGQISGDLLITANTTLGPKEITGNLLMTSNNKILTITGTVYVHGYIDIDNGSAIKCDTSYGTNSCIVITDSWIHVANNGTFSGSGQPESFLMMLATSSCDDTFSSGCTHHNAAVDIHNQATGVIFYAPNGMINLHNGVNITEATGYKLKLDNTASITYDQGLANAQFSSGPGASWQINNWKEVE